MINLKIPTINDMPYIAKLWSDHKTMEDVGGIHIIKENEYQTVLKKLVALNNAKYFLILENDNPIGEVSFTNYDKESKTAILNIKIEYSKRRAGHAKQALDLFTEYYFYKFGGEILEDFVTSPSGIKFLRNYRCIEKELLSINDMSKPAQAFMQKYNVDFDEVKQSSVYFILNKQM